MYKEDLALNNLQCLIYHKTQTNQIIYLIYMYKEDLALNKSPPSYRCIVEQTGFSCHGKATNLRKGKLKI